MASLKPLRVEGLEIHTVVDGYIVYHKERDRVHYLNQTAALVLELCDGQKSTNEISVLVQESFELPEPPNLDVNAILDRFTNEGLIQ